MTTIGKVCLWLTVIGLGVVSVWLLPVVGKQHNEISAKLVSSKAALDATVKTHGDTAKKLSDGQHQLARLQVGWDKSWNIQQTANVFVKIDGATLAVEGLGLDSGLEPVLDDGGQPVQPVVHAFKTKAEGGMFYVGEFQAEQLEATFCTLTPNWQATQDEVDIWSSDAALPWRFRTLVPATKRLKIDQVHQQLQQLSEIYAEIEDNVAQQTALREQAEAQLITRKQELLGNPDAQPTPGRPEYSDGLLKTISAEEDHRNDLLIDVDGLRRRVKEAIETREQILRRLKESAELLQSASADDDRVSQARAEVQ